MNTTATLETYKGKRGTIKVNKLTVGVKVVDARMRYGHLDLLIEPVAGEGAQWTEHHKVSIANETINN